MEVEWIETSETVSVASAPEIPSNETFQEIILPPLEIPHTIFEPLPKIEFEPPKEIPKTEKIQPEENSAEKFENKPAKNENPTEEKEFEKPEDKLKVIVKVYPKDIAPQLIKGGIIKESPQLKSEKIILEITITTEGKVRDVDNGWIDFVSKNAAGGWIFEPYLDEEGNPRKLRTQIEFMPEDF